METASCVIYPMKRTSARGAGAWQRLSWDDALDEMTGRLLQVRHEHGPLALCGAVSNAHFSRGVSLALLMRAFGSPNWMMNQDLCGGCRGVSDKLTGLAMGNRLAPCASRGSAACPSLPIIPTACFIR